MFLIALDTSLHLVQSHGPANCSLSVAFLSTVFHTISFVTFLQNWHPSPFLQRPLIAELSTSLEIFLRRRSNLTPGPAGHVAEQSEHVTTCEGCRNKSCLNASTPLPWLETFRTACTRIPFSAFLFLQHLASNYQTPVLCKQWSQSSAKYEVV